MKLVWGLIHGAVGLVEMALAFMCFLRVLDRLSWMSFLLALIFIRLGLFDAYVSLDYLEPHD